MTAVPDAVRRKAVAVGPEGHRWLEDLTGLVAELATRWELDVGDAIDGGSGAFVAPARTADGTDVVLKVAIPDGLVGHAPFARELHVLGLGAGRGYVRVLRADPGRRAMLQERLGRPLSSLGLPVEAQIDALVATLRRGWCRLPDNEPLRTGAEQAALLERFVRSVWLELARPCPEDVIARAERFARSRRAAFDPSTAVLVHGDAHPANLLEDGRGGFALIDPDGMRSEPAHDLAIALRDWTDELLAADDSVATGVEWCARLAERAGVAAPPIWEWAYVERVSTGLFLLQLGDLRGRDLLEVAASWTEAPSVSA